METGKTASRLRLYARLQLAAHALKKAADRQLVPVAGLSTAQAAVLAVIQSESKPAQKAVAAALGLNESAMTAMVGRLTSMGYVARTTTDADQRVRRLVLTPDGTAALAALAGPFEQINRRIEAALGSNGVEALATALDALNAEFGRTGD